MLHQPAVNPSSADHERPKFPEPLVTVIVQTPEFRCMGYLDRDGRWYTLTRKEIVNVISWTALA